MVSRTSFFAAGLAAAALSQSIKLNNGVSMPLINLGTAGWDDSAAEEALVLAVEAGMTGVDTAYRYGTQVGVGKALKRVNRSEVFVTTKTNQCYYWQVRDPEACAEYTRKQIEADFQQLDVQYIDLLLVHGANHYSEGSCSDLSCELNVAQWKVYEEYYKVGKLRAIGVSNYCPSCLDCLLAAAEVPPTVNQLQFHVGMTADPEGIMSYSTHRGIVPMAYSPMGSGMVFSDPLCQRVGRTHNKTAAQVALKWIVDKNYSLATKTSSRQHLMEDLDLFSWELLDDERQQIDLYSNSQDTPSWACTAAVNSVSV